MAGYFRVAVGMAATALGLSLLGCGGGGSISDLNHTNSGAAVNGLVFKGPVSNGKVTVYKMDDAFRQGDALGSGATDGNGAFSVSLPPYSGHLLLVANSGTYMEEAMGVSAALDGTEMDTVIPGYAPGTTVNGVLLSPVSHLVVVLANSWSQHEGKTVQNAVEEAWVRLNNHFGGLDWRTVVPTDFNTAGSGVQIGDPGRAGLLLGALSQQALSIANRAGVTPGSGFKTAELINALADDLRADGYFDGVGPNGPVVVPSGRQVTSTGPSATALDGQTVRLTLSFAMTDYLQNSRNHSGITFADAQNLISSISSNSDTRIFRQPGQTFDNTPPVLAFAVQPARYTNQATSTFQVRAADPDSGVMAVYAQDTGHPAVQGNRVSGNAADGVYSFSMPVFIGLNTLTIWAVDHAGNSGLGKPPPYQLQVLATYDSTPKTPNLVSFASYFSEQNLRVQVNGAGVPLVPPTFQVPGTETKVSLGYNSTIWKVSNRLSWGTSAPSGAQLESQQLNSPNTPFLQFEIGYAVDINAPLTQVRYSIAASCAGCQSFPAAVGDLIPASRTAPQQLFFDLPLSSETLPALVQMKSSPLTLQVSVTTTDAAGNMGTLALPATLSFRVIGPPLAVVQENNYPGFHDVRSVFPYKIADGTYHQSWSPNSTITADSTGESGVIRVQRYIVYNPYSAPIAVASVSGSGLSWVVNEEWDEAFFRRLASYDFFVGPPLDECVLTNIATEPCGGHLEGKWLAGQDGQEFRTFTCTDNPPPSSRPFPPGVYTSGSSISLRAYRNPQAGGAERDRADERTDDAGAAYFLVPAATAIPGAVAAYVVRPYIPSRTSGVTQTLNWTNYNDFQIPYGYRNTIQIAYISWYQGYAYDQACGYGFTPYGEYVLRNHVDTRSLVSGNEVFSGNLNFASGTLRPDGHVMNDLKVFGSAALPATVNR